MNAFELTGNIVENVLQIGYKTDGAVHIQTDQWTLATEVEVCTQVLFPSYLFKVPANCVGFNEDEPHRLLQLNIRSQAGRIF